MKINEKVYLNMDTELRVFYYNDDSSYKDHESEHCKEGSTYIVVGYVPEKSNNIRLDAESGDFDNYAVVIKDVSTLELFRVVREQMASNFRKIELN